MTRWLPFAALLLLAAGCSRGPVLEIVLAPEDGAKADAASLHAAATVVAKRLDAAAGNARVAVDGSALRLALDAKSAAAWPSVKDSVLSPGGLAFYPVAMNPPFAEELAIETAKAGIVAKNEGGDWTYAALEGTDEELVRKMSELVALVTTGDSRWLVLIDGSNHTRSPVAIIVDRDGAMEHVAITHAKPQASEMGPLVNLQLGEADAERFAALTARMMGKKIAIVADGEVNATPVVRDRISGGTVQISIGSGSTDPTKEARMLAASLVAGELPFALTVSSEYSVR